MNKRLIYIIFGMFLMLYGCGSQDKIMSVTGSDSNSQLGSSDHIGSGGNADSESGSSGGSGNVDEGPLVYYTVTFHGNGADELYNTMHPFVNCSRKGIELPENRYYKDGFKFVGWSIAENDELMYRNMQVITCDEDIDLYALWEEKPTGSNNKQSFRIFFNANGGDGTMGSMQVYEGEKAELKKSLFVRNGYQFAGWSTSLSGRVEYHDGGTIDVAENVTLYAVWTKNGSMSNTVKLTLKSNVENISDEVFYVEKGKEFYFPYNKLSNGDKVFIGWSSNSGATKQEYQEGSYGFFNNDTILYGVWVDKSSTYKVIFDCNGGLAINMPEAIYVLKNSTVFAPRISCDLFNRKSANKYTKDISDTINSYVTGSLIPVNEDLHLYALWNIEDYVLDQTFGGDCSECKNMTFFAKGVKVPTEQDWVLGENQITKTVLWKEGVNWFHVFQSSYNLCWAASASNAFHWWTTLNDKYIKAYYQYKEKNGEIVNKPDLFYSPIGKANFKQSGIFRLFSHGGIWPNSGNNPSYGFLWLMIGVDDKDGGAFFKEVFENSNTSISYVSYNIGKKKFNEMITDMIKNQKGIIGLGTVTTGPHALTLWGATYGSDGYINGIYTSDSATDGKTFDGQWGGLEYDSIVYNSSGLPFIQNLAGNTFPILAVYTFQQNEQVWIDYLNKNNIEIPK